MSEETEPNIEGNDAFTEADIELTSTLHSLLNDVIIAVKEAEFNREELEAQLEGTDDPPYGKEDALGAYQIVGVPLMKFASMLNDAVLSSVFKGIDPEELVAVEGDCPCECESSDTPSA